MGWFGVAQYKDKQSITIINLVDTMCLTRYPWLLESTHDQESEFIGHEFKNPNPGVILNNI